MAYVIQNKSGRWEIRQSQMTDAGPRSRTLATFAALDDKVIERAASRASEGVGKDGLRRAARRAGAPLAEPDADRAARDLLTELAADRRPRRALGRLLAETLESNGIPSSDLARWVGASLEQRGEALIDLLHLGDALPAERLGKLKFPRLGSR